MQVTPGNALDKAMQYTDSLQLEEEPIKHG